MVSAEMVFDVMGFMQQLQRASSISPESSIVPNTLEMALQPTREARAIIRSHPPQHMAIHVNEAWTVLLGHTQSEAEGIPLTRLLRVDNSQYSLLNSLSREVAAGRPGSAIVISGGEGMRALLYVKVKQSSVEWSRLTCIDVPAHGGLRRHYALPSGSLRSSSQ